MPIEKKKKERTLLRALIMGVTILKIPTCLCHGERKKNVAEKLFKEPMFFYQFLRKQFQIQETHKSPYRLNMNKICLYT